METTSLSFNFIILNAHYNKQFGANLLRTEEISTSVLTSSWKIG